MEAKEITIIKDLIEEVLQKMMVRVFSVQVDVSQVNDKECMAVDVNVDEPQVLIGQNGQTLLEFQRLLRIILNKKLQKDFYLDLDINNYKKQKLVYLKKMAQDLATEVLSASEERVLPPMSSYERRIIHSELAGRTDIVTQSQGEGLDRYIVIKPV